jgi:hypothetical protein
VSNVFLKNTHLILYFVKYYLLKPVLRKLHCYFIGEKTVFDPHQKRKFPHHFSRHKKILNVFIKKLTASFVMKIEAVIFNKTFDMTFQTAQFHQDENIRFHRCVTSRNLIYSIEGFKAYML